MLMPSLRACPFRTRAARLSRGVVAVTLLTDAIGLADSAGSGDGRKPTCA